MLVKTNFSSVYTREYLSGLEFEDGDLVAAVVGDGRLVIGETAYRDKTAPGGVPTVHAEYWHKDHPACFGGRGPKTKPYALPLRT